MISDPAGTRVAIDGWFLAEAPFRRTLPLGSLEVAVRTPGYERDEVRVRAGSERRVNRAELKGRRPLWIGADER